MIFLRNSVLFCSDLPKVEHLLREAADIIAEGRQEHKSYYLYNGDHVSYKTNPSLSASYLTWHHCLSHTSLRNLQDLKRRGEIKVSVNDSEDVMKCEDCVVGKLSRLNTKNKSNHKVSETLACVHSDLCSLPTKSYNGSKYFITFLDEKTHFVVLYVLNSKDQALAAFKHYPAFAERDTGKKLKTIRTENGGEYTSTDWNTYCLTSGITHSRGPPHSPQLHGKAERFNRTPRQDPALTFSHGTPHSLLGGCSSPRRVCLQHHPHENK